MWAAQEHDGASKGSWPWFALDDDRGRLPTRHITERLWAAHWQWRSAAIVPQFNCRENARQRPGGIPAERSGRPTLAQSIDAALGLAALLATLPKADCAKLVEEALERQQPDGGWTMGSLGPWKQRPAAPPSSGSNAYATAVVALALEQTSLQIWSPSLARALGWLRAHQDPAELLGRELH